MTIVRSIAAHRHVKGLGHFFNSTGNSFRLVDTDTLKVVSGKLRGLTFTFEHGLCHFSTEEWSTCVDVAGDFSAQTLLRVLVKHNMIRDSDWEEPWVAFEVKRN